MIKFYEVTPLSRLLAIVLFLLILPVLTFYIGTQYQEVKQAQVDVVSHSTGVASTNFVATTSLAVNTANWQTYKSSTYDYEIKYPSEYKMSWNNSPVSTDVLGIDMAEYSDENYDVNIQVFARDGFVLDNCGKDASGKNITNTIKANGTDLYVYNDHEVGLGGRMALTQGAVRSEYKAIHQGYCYLIKYTITPNDDPATLSPAQLKERVDILDQIVSTFKFTK